MVIELRLEDRKPMECREPATAQYCSVNRIEVFRSLLLLIGPIIITGIISSIALIALQFRLTEHKARLHGLRES